MLAIRILMHSLRQVTGNLGAAAGVIGVPLLLAAFSVLPLGMIAGRLSSPNAPVIAQIVWMLIVVAVWLTSAVAWHRHVLLNEPAQFWRPGRGAQLRSYLGVSLGLVAVVLLAMIVVYMVIVIVGHPARLGLLGLILMTVAGLALAATLTRLSTALPGGALQQPEALRRAWQATRGQTGTFLVLTIAMGVIQTIASLPGEYLFRGSPMVAFIFQILGGFLSLAIGLSVATTLWGHFVERRGLN